MGVMTSQEIADRILMCISLGSVNGAVQLMRRHCNNSPVICCLKESPSWNAVVRDWLIYGAPTNTYLYSAAAYSQIERVISRELADELFAARMNLERIL